MGNTENENKKKDLRMSKINKMIPENDNSLEEEHNNNEEDEQRYEVNLQENQKPRGKVIIYGFLKKKSKYMHLWKTRFFILTNHYLFAFTGIENDADCTMALDLSNVSEIIQVEETEKDKVKNTFAIKFQTSFYYLKAENKDVMKRWIIELENVVRKIKNKKKELVSIFKI